MGFGALNEVGEFVATLLVPKTNVGGYANTGRDLVANLVGVLIAAVVLRFTSRGIVPSPRYASGCPDRSSPSTNP